jgi:DGQHR domain-containing protein
MKTQSTLDEDFRLELPCVRVSQPIGDFYIASIDSADLVQITFADVRKMYGEREVDTYLGIQRQVNKKRVSEIGDYVNTVDACFPTAVILAVDGRCAEYDEDKRVITLKTSMDSSDERGVVNKVQIARVLDGQHRIEGLRELKPGHPPFQVNVSIFVEMDIENQAYLFSVVNLAQTKVSKSLVYDLFEYSRSRSPQKTCHNVAVALDSKAGSPFEKRIKRLGIATEGRFTEYLTQATFVEALLKYISADPIADRDVYLRGKRPLLATADDLKKLIFRNLFIQEEDLKIADIVFNFFSAVSVRWPQAWASGGRGDVLNKTNGFKALMRVLRPAYLDICRPGEVPSQGQFLTLLNRVSLKDADFTSERFLPGTTGESKLYGELVDEMRLRRR